MERALDYLEPCVSVSTAGCGDMSVADGAWSQSNLSLFRYYAARECVHCPQHSDIGLITIIPTALGGAGLHIYDWKHCCWWDVESAAPPGSAVIVCGESLAALTAATRTVR